MNPSPLATIEITLALLLVIALIGALSRRVPIPLPLLLIGGGLALSALPPLANVRINPDVFFMLFIPPLLFSDGWLMPKRDFVRQLRPILTLAFGLVLFTVVGIGLLIHWLLPSLPLAAAFALGAIVSPTDAVATKSMTGKLSLPPRASIILDGESLINDASGLVAFRFAIAALATGAFSWSGALLQLAILAIGGVAAGGATAWVIGELRVGLKRWGVDEPTVQTVLSVLTPYAAYLAAEAAGVSGILAVVGAGLYAGWHDARNLDVATRTNAFEVWGTVLFIFNGLVFLLLGLSMRPALAVLGEYSNAQLAGTAIALWAGLTALRVGWVFPSSYLPHWLSSHIRRLEGPRDPREIFIVGWAGLRGSVTMAAALSIPLLTQAGEPFPGRDLLIFLAASTILLTLVINGLTLPLLIRALGVRDDGTEQREKRAAEIALAHAGASALESEASRLSDARLKALARRLIDEYHSRTERCTANAARRSEIDHRTESERRLALEGIRAERKELESLRDGDVINDRVAREIEARLDLAEQLARGVKRALD